MMHDDAYYIQLLKDFQSFDYRKKIKVYDEEFDILKTREYHFLAVGENGAIGTTDFEVIPQENNPLENEIFNIKVYSRIDDIVSFTRSENIWGFHSLDKDFRHKIGSESVTLFKLSTLIQYLENRLTNPTASKIILLEKEVNLIVEFVDRFKGSNTYSVIWNLFNKLIIGDEIDFSIYSFGSQIEFFLGIKIAENLAAYYSRIVEIQTDIKRSDYERIIEEKRKYVNSIVKKIVGIHIGQEHADRMESVLMNSYAELGEEVGWKTSIVNLISFIEDCKMYGIILYPKENVCGFIERCFYPLKTNIKSKKKVKYNRKTLLTEKSKMIKGEIVPNIIVDFTKDDVQ